MRPPVPTSLPQALQRALRGFFLSAATMDGGFFLIMVAMPFKVLALGGGALELGLVPAIGAVAYIVCAPLAGHWSDRVSRTLLCFGGGLVLVVCAVLALLIRRLELLLALQALMGLGKALYWPAVQATLADVSPGSRRIPVLGRFNVAWSTGKTLGFLIGGVLLACCGFRAVYLAGAASVVVAFVLLPKGRAVAAAVTAVAAQPATDATRSDAPGDPARLRRFLLMAWVANTAAYGAFGILTHHLPQWFAQHGWDAARYGWFLGAILASQTVVFVLLAGPVRLAWSAWRLWLPQALALVAVALIPVRPGGVAAGRAGDRSRVRRVLHRQYLLQPGGGDGPRTQRRNPRGSDRRGRFSAAPGRRPAGPRGTGAGGPVSAGGRAARGRPCRPDRARCASVIAHRDGIAKRDYPERG